MQCLFFVDEDTTKKKKKKKKKIRRNQTAPSDDDLDPRDDDDQSLPHARNWGNTPPSTGRNLIRASRSPRLEPLEEPENEMDSKCLNCKMH